MKSIWTVILFYIFTCSLLGQIGNSTHTDKSQYRNLTLKDVGEENPLFSYIIGEVDNDFIQFHPFSIGEIGSWNTFFQALTKNPNITFEFVSLNEGRMLNGAYYRYQQYYQGIPVFGGGFTIFVTTDDDTAIIAPPCPGCPGPDDPCFNIAFLFANIYEGFNSNFNTSYTISESSLNQLLSGQNQELENSELFVFPKDDISFSYRIAYRANYNDIEKKDLVGWIDAYTGELLYESLRHDLKYAPTANYGVQFLNDESLNGITFLKNERLEVQDFTPVPGDPAVVTIRDARLLFDDDRVPRSPDTIAWDTIHAPTEIFQAFWMADTILSIFESELGVVSGKKLKIGVHPSVEGAANINSGDIPDDEYRIVFGVVREDTQVASTVEFDIVGHELGHTILHESEVSSSGLPGRTIHEALAEMYGTYAEAKVEQLDWVIGDNDSLLSVIVNRNLQNPEETCFSVVDTTTTDPYLRSEPLIHWFYLCVNGNVTNDIPPMNIDELMAIITEALPNIGVNPDYEEFMNATVGLAELVYGSCSDQLRTIVRAWEYICVPTGYQIANGPCTSIFGGSSYCEEDNYFELCLTETSQLPLGSGRWTITGRNSTSFESFLGMQGNSQYGGSCLQITQIPTMPYYPQTITIKYWHPDVGELISRHVKIVDCDNDDPTCNDYYGSQELVNINQSSNVESEPNYSELDNFEQRDDELNTIVYDMMGRQVLFFDDHDIFGYSNSGEPQILIVTYWDHSGKLVKTRKVLSK